MTSMKVPKKFETMALSARGWLDELYTDANRTRAPAQLKNDFATAMRWLGIRSFSEIRQDHYEMWSAGFVYYLAEGNAPSASLRDQFQAFAKWAKQEPPRPVALDDDIRGVFGRLLSFDTAMPGHSNNTRRYPLRWILYGLGFLLVCGVSYLGSR
jgi:hypothetical protein